MLAAILSGFFVSSPALDLKMDSTLGKNAGEIQLGPVAVIPSMKVITRHDDNLLRSENKAGEVVSWKDSRRYIKIFPIKPAAANSAELRR